MSLCVPACVQAHVHACECGQTFVVKQQIAHLSYLCLCVHFNLPVALPPLLLGQDAILLVPLSWGGGVGGVGAEGRHGGQVALVFARHACLLSEAGHCHCCCCVCVLLLGKGWSANGVGSPRLVHASHVSLTEARQSSRGSGDPTKVMN